MKLGEKADYVTPELKMYEVKIRKVVCENSTESYGNGSTNGWFDDENEGE